MKYLWLYFFFPGLLACEDLLRVGADLNWPPYSYEVELEPKGFDVAAVKAIFEPAGYCLLFVNMPSALRAQEELASGQVHILMAASFSEKRSEKALFSQPYRSETMLLISHKNSPVKAISLSEAFANGGTFAVNAGSYMGREFARMVQSHQEQVVYLPSTEQRLFLLNTGRVDFLVEDTEAVSYIVRQHGLRNVVQTSVVVYQNPIHLMLNTDRFTPQQVDSINQQINLISLP